MAIEIKRRLALAVILGSILLLGVTACQAANLLANPGFEEGYDLMYGEHGVTWQSPPVTHGWTAVFPGTWSYSVEEIHYGADARFHTGTNAMSHSTEASGESISRQTVWVVPGATYTASVYAKGLDYSGNSTGFGAEGTTDSAGLKIRELDYQGNLVVDHTELAITDPVDYTLLTETFQANVNTYKIEYSLHSLIACHYSAGRTAFDDAVLDGPAGVEPVGNVTGVVRVNGSPVSGALVTCNGKTSTTGADGVYTITGALITAMGNQVNAQLTGYLSQNMYPVLTPGGTATADFALDVAPTNNRLANGDFEEGGPYATSLDGVIGSDKDWTFQLWTGMGSPYTSFLRRESLVNKDAAEPDGVSFPWQPHGGNEASRNCTSGQGFHLVYQEIPVAPSSPYKASLWVKARNFDDQGFGVPDSGDYAGLHIQEFSGSTLVLDHPIVSITGGADWVKLTDDFTTDPTTTKVIYFMETSIGGLWADFGHWQHGQVIYDDAVLDGPDAVAQITGTVYKAGERLAGATVTAAGLTATTDLNGEYTISGIEVTSEECQVTASEATCWSENKFVTLVHGPNAVNFDLYALPASQLLTNGNFETPGAPYIAWGNNGDAQTNSGWTCRLWSSDEAYLRRESTVIKGDGLWEQPGVGPGPWKPYSGAECSRQMVDPEGQIEISQTVWVQPNAPYTASVMAKLVNLSPGDYVSLQIQELDEGGSIVSDHMPVFLAEGTEWTRLSDDFTTTTSTAKIKYFLYTSISAPWSTGWANVDCAVLDGPYRDPAQAYVAGTVRIGGTPVSGAVVTVEGKSGTSGTNGIYSISNVPMSEELTSVTVQFPGYLSENKWVVLVTGTNVIDFDLVALPANNLLTNPGFEDDQAPYIAWEGMGAVHIDQSWTTQLSTVLGNPYTSYLRRESSYYQGAAEPEGVGNGPWTPHSGTEGSRHCTSAQGHHQVYQDIMVVPETLYKASVWVKAVDRDSTGFGVDGSNDSAGLHIIELAADDSIVLDHTPVVVTSPTDWTRLAEEFTTQAGTTKVRYMMETFIGGLWSGYGHWQHGWVTYDDAALDGQAPAPYEDVATIQELKAKADETRVRITGKVVTSAFSGFFYIEEADRTNGIKVTGTAVAGDIVTVAGTIKTVDGERTFVSDFVSAVTGGTIPGPLGMNNKVTDPQAGIPTVGLYVTIWGRVDSVGGSPFTLTDGSGANLKVYAPSGYSATPDDYVSVIGALGAETSGATVQPVVRAISVTKAD